MPEEKDIDSQEEEQKEASSSGDDTQIDKDAEIERLKRELEIQKEKDRNYQRLNKKAKKSEEEKTEMERRLEALEKELENERAARVEALEKKRVSAIEKLSGGDKDLAEKIEFYYSRMNIDNSEEAVLEAINDAYILASKGRSQPDGVESINVASVASGAFAGSSYAPKDDDFSMSEEGIEFAKRLGLKYPNIKQSKE